MVGQVAMSVKGLRAVGTDKCLSGYCESVNATGKAPCPSRLDDDMKKVAEYLQKRLW